MIKAILCPIAASLPLLVAAALGAAASASGSDGEVIPPGAIPVGDDLYQVPIGEDEDGCPMFRLFSPTQMVVQAIFWRTPEGDFTMDRAEADCPPSGGSGSE
jgi:hypothetical protein